MSDSRVKDRIAFLGVIGSGLFISKVLLDIFENTKNFGL